MQVKIVRANNIPFLATGSRHGYITTFGDLQNGLAIDLSQFDSVKVDIALGTLTVGGGTRHRDFLDAVYEAGLEIR
ncbi:uncharacterized protein F4822DRAFT_414211, partial [Hypoxylon trugodes]|uniref:uncharacterized protein n=1 Tax=Hypoxylon trugodes TaxID=326681 RepID=UPI002191960C